jgi:hypothetical protein
VASGFGHGPFGSGNFGEWKWSRRVLYEYIPEIYKLQDQERGGLLEMFAESLRPSFNNPRKQIRDLLSLRDPLLARTQYDNVVRLRLGPALGLKGDVEQRGVTGSVDGLQQFVAPTARFKVSDIGKELFVSGSAFPQNNKRVSVASVVGSTTIVTDPLLAVDGGPLRWELRTKVVPSTEEITVEIRGGYVGDVQPGWILFDGFADFTVVGRRQFKLPIDFRANEKQLLTEQESTDGQIDGSGRFYAVNAQLDQQDVGKQLVLGGSQIPEHNDVFEILEVLEVAPGDWRAVIDASPALALDSGLSWAILPYAELDLQYTLVPKGVVEQEGIDLEITVSGVSDADIEVLSASFTASDIGKVLSIRGSQTVPVNDGVYGIVDVLSPTQAKIEQRAPVLIVETDLTWEVRSPSTIGDLTQVDVRASSLLQVLAKDFGITIDTQESEVRQRGWVYSVSQWIGLKGTQEGYRIIGAVSGFDISAVALYRFSAELATYIPDDSEYEVTESAAGRTGTDGTLQLSSGRYRLTAPTAAFLSTDVSRLIKITGAATGGNNKYYTIESVIADDTVEFLSTDLASLPDANNGTLTWFIVRLYTDLAPAIPVYDEVNSDLMEDIVVDLSGGEQDFHADKYCWEPDFYATVPIEVVSVVTPSPGVHTITVSGTADTEDTPRSPETVLKTGNWQFLSLIDDTSGTGDTIGGSVPYLTLTDSVAMFQASDVGRWIKLTGATTPSNDGIFLVTAVSSSVTLEYFNGAGVAEAFPGTWEFYDQADYFLDSVPVLTGALAASPLDTGLADDFTKAGNEMTLVDSLFQFLPEHEGRHLVITGSTSPANDGIFVINTYVNAGEIQYTNAAGVAEFFPGIWEIGLGLYEFNVASAAAPVSPGPGKLRYVCPVQLSCDYCAASKLLVTVEPTQELLDESEAALERLYDRVMSRVEDVTPAHVELIVRFRLTIEASLTLEASVEPTIV